MASATEDFRRELATLRDGLIQAIDGSVLGEIADGLDLYADLVRAVLQSYRPYEEQLQVQPRTWRSNYGRVMEWLQQDLFLFAKRTLASGEVEVVRSLLEMLNDLLDACVSEDEVDAHGVILAVYERIWRLGPSLLESGWEEARSAELAWLTSHLEYRLGPAAETDSQAARSEYVRQVFATLVTFARTAIDEDRPEDLAAAVESLHELFQRFTLGRREAERLKDGPKYLLLLREVYALALEGYVLMRLRFKRSNEVEAKRAYEIVSKATNHYEPWLTYWHIKNPELIGDLGFSWWELGLFEGRSRGGWMGFGQDLTLAFTIRLLDGRVDDAPPIQELRKYAGPHNVRFFLERVVSDGFESDRLSAILNGLGRQKTRESQVRDGISAAVNDLKAEEAAETARLPILDERIESFLSAVVRSWSEATPLRRLARSEMVAVDPTAIEDRVVFGTHQLVPKSFFAETHVHAAPDDIGRDYGRAIARGETNQGLKALEDLDPIQVAVGEVKERVVKAIDELRATGHAPSVLIVNSWQLREQLVERQPESEDNGLCGDVSSAPVYFEYADGADQVVVADFHRSVVIRRLPLKHAASWERILADGRLLAGVRQIDSQRAHEMITGNSEFRRGPSGRFMSAEDAALALQQSVETKAHARFEWAISEPKSIRRFVVVSRVG